MAEENVQNNGSKGKWDIVSEAVFELYDINTAFDALSVATEDCPYPDGPKTDGYYIGIAQAIKFVNQSLLKVASTIEDIEEVKPGGVS